MDRMNTLACLLVFNIAASMHQSPWSWASGSFRSIWVRFRSSGMNKKWFVVGCDKVANHVIAMTLWMIGINVNSMGVSVYPCHSCVVPEVQKKCNRWEFSEWEARKASIVCISVSGWLVVPYCLSRLGVKPMVPRNQSVYTGLVPLPEPNRQSIVFHYLALYGAKWAVRSFVKWAGCGKTHTIVPSPQAIVSQDGWEEPNRNREA